MRSIVRILIEVLVVVALVAAAWQKPFRQLLGERLPMFAQEKAPAAGATAVARRQTPLAAPPIPEQRP